MRTPTASSWTMSAIRKANKTADGHFFDRASMRFFGSYIVAGVHEGPGGVFFVTSEAMPASGSLSEGPRLCTVRRFHPLDGDITTDGPFNELTKSQAKERARARARGSV